MKTLGPKFTLIAALAAASVAVTVLASVLSWWSVALPAISVLGMCLLAALALVRKDVLLLRKGGMSTRTAEPGAGSAGAPAIGHVDQAKLLQAMTEAMTQQRAALARDQEQALRRVGSDLTQQVAAAAVLHQRHLPPLASALELPGAMATQFAPLLDEVTARPVARALAVGAGTAGLWLAHAVAAGGGHTDVLTAVPGEADRLTALWSDSEGDRVQNSSERAGLRAVQVATVVPEVPHALVRWYDVSQVTDVYDLVLIWVPTTQSARATLHARPLITPLLGEHGRVVVIESDPDRPVATAWDLKPTDASAADPLNVDPLDS